MINKNYGSDSSSLIGSHSRCLQEKPLSELLQQSEPMKAENHKSNPLSLYIHIPFCIKKCRYCDFLSAPAGEETHREYVRALLHEIEYWGKLFSGASIKSVYIGGGTPSVLPEDLMIEILCKLKTVFPGSFNRMKIENTTGQEQKSHDSEAGMKMSEETGRKGKTLEETAKKEKAPEEAGRKEKAPETAEPEISMEINPGTVTEKKLKAYIQAGINRLSIGLQSADKEELKLLGRIHTYEDFLETYYLARAQGFSNLNVDLISALPGQKQKSWQGTLEKVVALRPEHISAYSLIIEEGTPFYETYSGHEELLPDEETDRAMYALTKHMLHQAGYERYEISNYSRKGKECLHNLVYWQRGNYLGMGLGSSSMIENIRFRNTDSLRDYVNYWKAGNKKDGNVTSIHGKTLLVLSDFEGHKAKEQEGDENIQKALVIPHICMDIKCLSQKEQMEEFMFLGLRMMKGVSVKEFGEAFGKSIFDVYGCQIDKYKKMHLLTVDERIALTDRGVDVSNVILADFLLLDDGG